MAISEKETIVSLDFNFSNGGGGHTATITSVEGAKDLSTDDKESLGSLIGSRGGRVTFTNDQLGVLLNNFVVTEITSSRDSVGKTIVRKLQDITSLKLKSHCFLVRGRDSHPKDAGVFGSENSVTSTQLMASGGQNLRGEQNIEIENTANPYTQVNQGLKGSGVILPYFGEVANSPINNPEQRFPKKPVSRKGAAIFVGQVYNEESSVDKSGNKVSLVYQNKNLQDGVSSPLDLSYNTEFIGQYYKTVPDYSNYALKFGYTLSEAKTGFSQAGIIVNGLPQDSSVLLEESGTLDNIVSAIASKFGYHWYIDPFTGAVEFINSSSAAQLKVYNPLSDTIDVETKKTFIDASFTQSMIQPRVMNVFSSTIERGETTFEMDTGERFTRFFKLNVIPLLANLKVDNSLLRAFYILYASGKYNNKDLFKVYSLLLQSMSQVGDTKNIKLNWSYQGGEETSHWPDSGYIKGIDKLENYETVFSDDGGTGSYAEKSTLAFDFKNAKYLHIAKTDNNNQTASDPSNYPIYDKMRLIFESLNNNVYLSHKFGRWKAERMSWQNAPINIEGPFKISSTNISEIDSMQNVNAVYTLMGNDSKGLSGFFDSIDDITGPSDGYGFIGLSSNGDKNLSNLTAAEINWDVFNDESFVFIDVAGKTYLAIHPNLTTQVKKIYNTSVSLWTKVTSNVESGRSIKAPYLRGKKTVSEAEETQASPANKRKLEEEESNNKAALDSIAQYLDELSERFDERYYSLNANGASGNIFSPISLDIKQGTISDIRALENNDVSSRISDSPPPQSSSRTIVGLSIPSEFSVTISSLSIRMGSSGITTTISESTANLLQPNEQLIIDKNNQAIATRMLTNRFNASQKNFLGL